MIYFILTLLIFSQIVSLYLIFNKIKPVVKQPGILLKPIPSGVKYEDVDKNYQLVRDVIESCKLEDWSVLVEAEMLVAASSSRYDVKLTSPSKDVVIRSRVRFYAIDNVGGGVIKRQPYLPTFIISSKNTSISIGGDSAIENELIEFLWGYIIKYHEDENTVSTIAYNNSIKEISSNLKTLSRNRKLNLIL